jgi:hypothetical protein
MKILQEMRRKVKAESLVINSAGQRPAEWDTPTNSSPDKGGINIDITLIRAESCSTSDSAPLGLNGGIAFLF